MSETIVGTIERVTHHNPENGFAILKVQVRGRRAIVTVKGRTPGVSAGEQIEATGAKVFDPQFGEQFVAETLVLRPPTNVEGIEKYLASGLVKGIGPKYAKKIVEVFKERTLEIIDQSPSFLADIKGIGTARIARIRESWKQQKAVRDIMIFLQTHGIGTQRAVRIYKTYGDNSVAIVRENPYRLATDIWGVGFATADELGKKLGIDPASVKRGKAALQFVLRELGQKGHVCCPEHVLVEETKKIPDLPEDVIRESIELLRTDGDLVREPGPEPMLYLKPLFLAELGIARHLARLMQGEAPLAGLDVPTALTRIEAKMSIELAVDQRKALAAATQEKVLVITGGPGTGKTTIVRGILELYATRGRRCLLCAPTGRAAKRLHETTGREAKTIHRLLEFNPMMGGFERTDTNPLEVDLLVVDETSMVDTALMNALLRALPAHASVVLVGDTDQLPSVGPGSVLGDMIISAVVPVVRLRQIFRQAGQSHIVQAAHAIRDGEIPASAPTPQGDFFFIESSTPETIIEKMLTMITDRIPSKFGLDRLRDIQVLTPMNRSELGTQLLNARLQSVLNPKSNAAEVERFGRLYRVGDKVMQTQNNYTKDVFNGDVGVITNINDTEREVTIEYDGKPLIYDFEELDEITLSYAVTIHKSQGSEYPAVIIPLHTQHWMMLRRNLLYTGVTRGKKLVVVIGSRSALEIAIQNADTATRWTMLPERIRKAREKDNAAQE
jgi:exodeoxyribonuclease V alpha subunit